MTRLCAGIVGVAALVLVGCGGSGDEGSTGGGGERCTASFVWWQKDAYSDGPGRSSPLWPPHTATELSVACGSETDSSTQANHGTAPGERDAQGRVLLVETKRATVKGTREELFALREEYQRCNCDGGTEFLSLDDAKDPAVEELFQLVTSYFQQHLDCPFAGGVGKVVTDLMNGDFDAVIAEVPQCTWKNGASFEGGLDAAFAEVLQATQEVLADYHVCNNDAALQAALFEQFTPGEAPRACNGDESTCHGPRWFYEP